MVVIESHSSRINDFLNLKQTNESCCQLTELYLYGEVTGGEPDLLSRLVGGSRCPVPIHQTLVLMG